MQHAPHRVVHEARLFVLVCARVQLNPPISACQRPNEYVFLDNLHPSSRAYGIVTQSLIKTMLAANVGFNRSDLVRPEAGRRRLIASDLD